MFSWQNPIEQELLGWARYMKISNQKYIKNTIWGKKQKREAEIYVKVFEMVEDRIEKEISRRITSNLKSKKELEIKLSKEAGISATKEEVDAIRVRADEETK